MKLKTYLDVMMHTNSLAVKANFKIKHNLKPKPKDVLGLN